MKPQGRSTSVATNLLQKYKYILRKQATFQKELSLILRKLLVGVSKHNQKPTTPPPPPQEIYKTRFRLCFTQTPTFGYQLLYATREITTDEKANGAGARIQERENASTASSAAFYIIFFCLYLCPCPAQLSALMRHHYMFASVAPTFSSFVLHEHQFPETIQEM